MSGKAVKVEVAARAYTATLLEKLKALFEREAVGKMAQMRPPKIVRNAIGAAAAVVCFFRHRDSFRGRFASTTMAELSAAGNGGGQGSARPTAKAGVA